MDTVIKFEITRRCRIAAGERQRISPVLVGIWFPTDNPVTINHFECQFRIDFRFEEKWRTSGAPKVPSCDNNHQLTLNPLSSRLFLCALRTRAKDLQRVGDVLVAHFPRHPLQFAHCTEIEHLDAAADTADDVVMVVLTLVDLVSVGIIAKIAPTDDTDLFHGLKRSIDGDHVAAFPLQFVM
jgi:hypothetical protein